MPIIFTSLFKIELFSITPSHTVLFMITQHKYTLQTFQGQMKLEKKGLPIVL